MTDIEEVYIKDLYKKHKGKELYKGFYSIGKKIYQDDGEIVNEGFALDKEALEILRAKIMAILIEDLPIKENKSNSKRLSQESLWVAFSLTNETNEFGSVGISNKFDYILGCIPMNISKALHYWSRIPWTIK